MPKMHFKYFLGKKALSEREKRCDKEFVFGIYDEIGGAFGYMSRSVKKLVTYAKAIDHIQSFLPDIAEGILKEEIKIGVTNTIALSRLDFANICVVIKRHNNEKTPIIKIINEQKALKIKSEKRGRPKGYKPNSICVSVKDAPVYDPDAQINALIYTLPSWINMIERVFSATDLNKSSLPAKEKLINEMITLKTTAEVMAALITEEVKNGH
jgi:hypothetical protein